MLSRLTHWVTRFPRTQFIVCVQPLESPIVVAANLAGAVAVLDHRVPVEYLRDQLLTLSNGTRAFLGQDRLVDSPIRPGSPLSSQERRVLLLLQEGSGYASIANTLSIAIKTVERHVGSIRKKFGIPKTKRVSWVCYDGHSEQVGPEGNEGGHCPLSI